MPKAVDPLTLTPRQAIVASVSLAIYCRGCSMLRESRPEIFVAGGRGDQPFSSMKFRCRTCEALRRDQVQTGVFLSWWDEGRDYRWDSLKRTLDAQ